MSRRRQDNGHDSYEIVVSDDDDDKWITRHERLVQIQKEDVKTKENQAEGKHRRRMKETLNYGALLVVVSVTAFSLYTLVFGEESGRPFAENMIHAVLGAALGAAWGWGASPPSSGEGR